MAHAYIHLDSIDTLEDYLRKLEGWKEILDNLKKEMSDYHASLEQDQKWYGQSHNDFDEDFIKKLCNGNLQQAFAAMEDGQKSISRLKDRAEELGN